MRTTIIEGEFQIIELAVCAASHLILRPGELYRFYIARGCEACLKIAEHFVEHKRHEEGADRI